jgi:hemolysin activation/secretion protein
MKTLLLSSAAIALVAGAVPAGAQAPAKTARPMADKTLTRTELTQTIQRQFARIDANKDGFVVKAEADAADKAIVQRTEQRLEKRGDTLFAKLDSNKDGKVTKAEADAAFAAAGAKVKAKAKPSWDKFAARLDANKDGAITKAEFDSAQDKVADRVAHRGGMAARMLATADTNKDGKVSLQEATAAAVAHFDKADSNKDGKLTADELRSGRHAMAATSARR